LAPFGLVWAWRNREKPGPRFCLAWLIPTWIVLELVPTKLPHYVLPLYPALGLMAAGTVIHGREALQRAMGRWPGRVWLGLWCVVGLALGALAPVLSVLSGGTVSALTLAPSIAALLVVALGATAFIKRKALLTAVGPAPLMALFMGLIFAAALPSMGQLWPSAAARTLVSAHLSPKANPGPIAAAGYHEPSLVFALGTATILSRTTKAARYITGKPGRLALVERRRKSRFQAALAAAGFRAIPLGTVRGFNTAKGKSVTLTLYRAEKTGP
jgi:4-amino-4-deoxy-L-arabinose transferase-like glycosyltransferase